MKQIVKALLMEGIDEDTIHRVLDVIAEEYELVEEGIIDGLKKVGNKIADKATDAITNSNNPLVDKLRKTSLVSKTVGKRALINSRNRYDNAQKEEASAIKDANKLKGKSRFKGTEFADPQQVIDRAYDSQRAVRQARKNWHDTIDKYNVKIKDSNYQKIHNDYQKTHDKRGNRIHKKSSF